MRLAVDFSLKYFIMLRKFPSIPGLLSNFIMKGYWILWNVFPASRWLCVCVFCLHSTSAVHYIDWFSYVAHIFSFWDKSHMVIDFYPRFMLTWSLVAQRLQCGRPGFDPWVGKIPWRRKWQPTPVFLPGKSHGLRLLVGYSPWGRRVGHDWETSLHFLARSWATIGARVFKFL